MCAVRVLGSPLFKPIFAGKKRTWNVLFFPSCFEHLFPKNSEARIVRAGGREFFKKRDRLSAIRLSAPTIRSSWGSQQKLFSPAKKPIQQKMYLTLMDTYSIQQRRAYETSSSITLQKSHVYSRSVFIMNIDTTLILMNLDSFSVRFLACSRKTNVQMLLIILFVMT